MTDHRVAGYSVDGVDVLYVILLVAANALMWNATELANLVHESTGVDTSSAHWMFLVLWITLSAFAAVGLATRKRTLRK